ncbi:MAG TPA: acyl-CoA dehydrogenase family protein, partial [Phototrophicaceae bacterium]|nr:acyl-CoA dehydrogenase family protein [Phototrophicaceae bacterium]
QLPPEDMQALNESGYLAFSVPKIYGGRGLALAEYVAAQLELAQGSASSALVAAMSLHIFGNARENRPWPEDKFEYLCRLAVAGKLINSVASEPVLGSPSRGGQFATTAAPHADGWVINGQKTWITGGAQLDYLLVRLSVESDPAVIWVANHAPGVAWVETWKDALSLRASGSHDVYFKDVVVPAENLLECGNDPKRPPEAWFPMMIAAVYLGTAIAARNAIIKYALERVPTALGQPIATLPGIQRQIGELDVQLQAARCFLLKAAEGWGGEAEQRRCQYPGVIAAKVLATETAAAVTEKALRIAGGMSLTHALPLERFFRDTRAGMMHPPAGDAALELIGKAAIEQIKGD